MRLCVSASRSPVPRAGHDRTLLQTVRCRLGQCVRNGYCDMAVTALSRSPPHKNRPRADHRVSPAHNIDSRPSDRKCPRCARDMSVRHTSARSLPFVIEKFGAAVLLGTHRIIIRQDRRAVIDALLVRRIHIAERRAFIKNIVPRERKILRESRFRPVFQKQIRDEPRVMLKFVGGKRCVFAKPRITYGAVNIGDAKITFSQ